MRRLWMLVLLLAPLTLALRAGDVPAKQETGQQQAKGNVLLKRAVGDLYFDAIGQQDDWRFLPEGFAKVVRDQGKTLYREIHGRVLVGPTATKQKLLDDLDWMCENTKADDLVMLFIACHGNCTGAASGIVAARGIAEGFRIAASPNQWQHARGHRQQ